MPYEIAELLTILTTIFLIGTFILLFPISRRLGKAIEEWVKIRHESSPERDLLARIEVELVDLRNQVDGMDKRLDFLSDRQEFTESLIDQKQRTALPPDASVEPGRTP
jgi:predicted  nucleic acid-binding Zn-ribbon protein